MSFHINFPKLKLSNYSTESILVVMKCGRAVWSPNLQIWTGWCLNLVNPPGCQIWRFGLQRGGL